MINKDIREETFPMSPSLIAKRQAKDKSLETKILNNNENNYQTKKVEGVELVHYCGKIFVPTSLQSQILA